jgi:hypothetical protein
MKKAEGRTQCPPLCSRLHPTHFYFIIIIFFCRRKSQQRLQHLVLPTAKGSQSVYNMTNVGLGYHSYRDKRERENNIVAAWEDPHI